MNKRALKKADFTAALLKWHSSLNFREMPWKGEKEPYRIWLSEVILQQTRVDQGWAYYEKFIRAFPTISDLASAPEQQVFKLWEGLGYYSRCRNLIATAKMISTNLNGQFPTTYDEILALKGIGPYTAAAIASFAFGLPYAVVDGNVTRVLARYFGISTPIDSSTGKKEFAAMARDLLDPRQAGSYNQAIMDFGATVCMPRNPHCATCVQQNGCVAWQKGAMEQLPVKAKAARKKNRHFYYFVAETPEGQVYIRRRMGKDIWEGLYEFILYETTDASEAGMVLQSDFARQLFEGQALTVRDISSVYRQVLSHQRLRGQFITVRLSRPLTNLDGFQLVSRSALAAYAFPKFINGWLSDPSPAQSLF
ncbi:MAG TPA: A/G-specific adenine glycosylase [Puia sp.]|jgi:A/G-specific adenine glycosylase|nr:A/G-specific adenine glycosylase [Puia sp.]